MESSLSLRVVLWSAAVLGFAPAASGIVRWPGWQDEAMLLFAAAVIVLAAALVPRGFRQKRANIERVVRTALPFCAVCGYAINGLLVQADGCTVCPECGAAWRLPGATELP
jgi:hypothetical protein